ncbi:MAG: aldo/keto reductase [Bacillus sp. (in: firmicutes)]
MEKRKIGHSDLYVSEIGLGCMSLGTDEQQASKIIQTALDHGINYFDTADLYDYGVNEELVGKTLKSVRHDVVLATKVGNKWNQEKNGWSWDASKTYIKSAVKHSLQRLQTDYIDLYQLHGGTMDDNHTEVIEAFEELIKEGYIRYYGISSIRPNVIQSFLTKSSIVSVMMQYSLLDRRPEEWMPLFNEQQASIIARGPIAKGILSERMLSCASASIKEKGYLHYSYHELEELLGRLHETFSSRSILEIALQYVLYHDEVAAVIPGASNPSQVIENIKAVQAKKLTKDEWQLLRSLTIANRYEQHRT